MSRDSERQTILTIFKNEWDETTYPVRFPNQPFTEPASGIFAHILLIRGIETRLELGRTNYLVRCFSNIQFDMYVPIDSGEKVISTMEDLFTPIFQDRQLHTADSELITFQQPNSMTYGPYNQRYRVSVRVPYYRDTRRSV